MTNQLSVRSIDIPQLQRFGIGFDSMFDRLGQVFRENAQQTAGYPPYNIVKMSDNKYAIELAVAGFGQGEVSIETKENQLSIEGKKVIEASEDREYVHRGISGRDFNRVFTLAENVKVIDAQQENGILTINLERQIPEEQRPKQIAVTYIN
jgi:molecular chaperone IbpA